MFLTLAFLFPLFSPVTLALPPIPLFIEVPNGGTRGTWGNNQKCPHEFVAKGFALKLQNNQGAGDDTAVNGLRLYCRPRNGNVPQTLISSSQGPWGAWTAPIFCSSGFLVSFFMKVQPDQGPGDDTAVNNFKFRCSDSQQLELVGLPWGSYGAQSATCPLGICGLQLRVEGNQFGGDDTALNNARFYCCLS